MGLMLQATSVSYNAQVTVNSEWTAFILDFSSIWGSVSVWTLRAEDLSSSVSSPIVALYCSVSHANYGHWI